MPVFSLRVSQRVFSDVGITAQTALEALRIVASAIEAGDLEEFPMAEVDNGHFEIEPVQTDAQGDVIQDEAFLAELVKLTTT